MICWEVVRVLAKILLEGREDCIFVVSEKNRFRLSLRARALHPLIIQLPRVYLCDFS